MKKAILFAIGAVFTISSSAQTFSTFHDFDGETITGDSIDFSAYYGKKVLVVNTASYCSYTHQYTDLQDLYLNYNQYNFEILGFPCNDFLNQEPGSDSTIDEFCQGYNVTFQMMSKVFVVTGDTAPVYKWLQRADLNGVQNASVAWNFNKFLIDEAGHWVRHVLSAVSPNDTSITNWIMQPSVLGIDDNKASLTKPVIFPNPSNGQFTVSYQLQKAETIKFSITDITGKLVYGGTFEKPAGTHLFMPEMGNALKAGVYSLSMGTETLNFTEKLVITH